MSHINTKCVQEGYSPKSGEARVLPIYQSTTFKYEDAKTLGDLFDFNASGHFYTRLSNQTVEAVEKKIYLAEDKAKIVADGNEEVRNLVHDLGLDVK